jgi:hypothetical protein
MRTILIATFILSAIVATAQPDKSKRPSPPALATETLASGAKISIDYSQPSVKGRTIGTDLEPMDGKVWRTGANEATVFVTDHDLMVEGQLLPAGKYGLFTVREGNDWTIIFSKTWNQWGAFSYNQGDDQLRVKVKGAKAESPSEKFTFSIGKDGKIQFVWGDNLVAFFVK